MRSNAAIKPSRAQFCIHFYNFVHESHIIKKPYKYLFNKFFSSLNINTDSPQVSSDSLTNVLDLYSYTILEFGTLLFKLCSVLWKTNTNLGMEKLEFMRLKVLHAFVS